MGRILFLIDMNAFFISCETARDPSLADGPAAVAGDPEKRSGIILTANYQARAYGVKTAMTIYQAQRLCPAIRLVPLDHRYYLSMSCRVMDIFGRYSPVIEQNSVDEAWLDMTGCIPEGLTPRDTAKRIMNEIQDSLGLWCSIGIAENKFLAKMAADIKKPKGITTLWKEEISRKLWPLPVESMYGVGRQTSKKLRSLGLLTIGDVARYGKDILSRSFGKYGAALFMLANGLDDSPVTPHKQGEMKSIGRSRTMPANITSLEPAKKVLMRLAEKVGADVRKYRKKAATVHITIKYADFSEITRQDSMPATNSTKVIFESAFALLKRNWSGRPVRLLGLSVSGFDSGSPQLTFQDLMDENQVKKQERLENTIDRIRQKYGEGMVERALLMEKEEDGRKKSSKGQECS